MDLKRKAAAGTSSMPASAFAKTIAPKKFKRDAETQEDISMFANIIMLYLCSLSVLFFRFNLTLIKSHFNLLHIQSSGYSFNIILFS